MDERDEVRELLAELFATPVRLPERGDVIVFQHESQLAAESYAAANREFYGYPAGIEQTEDGEWLSLVDIGPKLRELEAEIAARGGLDG